MVTSAVPDIVVRRLPLYLRVLTTLAEANHPVTSSQELADKLGISSAQIRKDLSYFGEFGKQGMGYEVAYLRDQLRRILQVDRHWEMALVGAGDLGHAIINYSGFKRWDCRIVAVFDSDPTKVGRTLGGLQIRDASELEQAIGALGVQIGIIAVPAAYAQAVAERMVRGGIRAILNYAPVNLNLDPEVRVHSIDPVVGLQGMTYYLNPRSA